MQTHIINRSHKSQHTTLAALADGKFRKNALLVGSTGVAASLMQHPLTVDHSCRQNQTDMQNRQTHDPHIVCVCDGAAHGCTASSAFKLPVKLMRRRELNAEERSRCRCRSEIS